jgi:hypothetical protein
MANPQAKPMNFFTSWPKGSSAAKAKEAKDQLTAKIRKRTHNIFLLIIQYLPFLYEMSFILLNPLIPQFPNSN